MKPTLYSSTIQIIFATSSFRKARLARERAASGIPVNKKGGTYEAEFGCKYCTRKFAFKKAQVKHERLHETDPDSPKLKISSLMFNCKYCSLYPFIPVSYLKFILFNKFII